MRIGPIVGVFLLGSALAADNLEKTQKKALEAEVKTVTAEAEKLEKTGQLAEGLRVVKSGLQPDDVVIINGIIKVRPDSPVRPQQGAMEQFSSNDISMPLTSSKASASLAGTDRTKATP